MVHKPLYNIDMSKCVDQPALPQTRFSGEQNEQKKDCFDNAIQLASQ